MQRVLARRVARPRLGLGRVAGRRFLASDAPGEQKTVHVSLDEENPQVDNFFDYTWGRWLENDKFEREARRTQFNLKGLVEVIKKNASKDGKAPQEADVEVKSIAPVHEGKHHKIYKVDLTDDRAFALRIPYALGHKQYREQRMKSEVATMDFLAKKHDVGMPKMVDWSADAATNPVGNEFQLMEFINGDLLMKSWDPSSSDIKLKSGAIKPIVDFVEKLVATRFNKYGSLYFTEDVPAALQNELPYEGETDSALADRWRIGQTTEARFWKGGSSDVTANLRGPWNSVAEYLDATAKIQLAYIHDALSRGDGNTQQLKKAEEAFDQYARIIPHLFQESDGLDKEIFSPRLHHPDLSPMNVLLTKTAEDEVKTYLLDFESTAIRPFLLHGPPKFVQHKGPKIFSTEDIPEFDTLPENEKRAINHFITQTQNQFAYEFLFKQAQEPTTNDLFTAFLPNVKRRQQLVDTALATTAETQQDLKYDIAMLSQEWQYLSVDREFPVPFSEQDLAQCASETEEWNKHIMANPFIETKGWVPADTFDALVKEGALLQKENGDYYFNAPQQ